MFSVLGYEQLIIVGSMIIIPIVIIIFVIIAILRFIAKRTKSKTPMDILKERYAKGEIGEEEFEAKKKDFGF